VYTPNGDYVGSDNYTLLVSDGNGGTATITVNVIISAVNDAPVFVNFDSSDRILKVGDPFKLIIGASDIDSPTIIHSVTGLPPRASFVSTSSNTAELTWTAANTEAGQRYALAFSISDNQLAATQTLNLEVAIPADLPAETTKDLLTVTVRVVDLLTSVALGGARVQVVGNPQIRYADLGGNVTFQIGKNLDRLIVRADRSGYESAEVSFESKELATGSLEIKLKSALVAISGNVLSGGVPLALAKVAARNSDLGLHETSTDAGGNILLGLPGPGIWNLAVGKEGYASNLQVLTVTGNLALDNIELAAQSRLAWSAYEVKGSPDQRKVLLKAQPPFQSGDPLEIKPVDNSIGNIGSPSFDSNLNVMTFTYTHTAGQANVQLSCVGTPKGGTSANTLINLNFQEVTQQKNIPIVAAHFVDRALGGRGDLAEEEIIDNGKVKRDPAGFQVPALGVSSNVHAIRIERLPQQLALPGVQPEGKVYRIDAIAISGNTETVLKDNSEVTEIFLTFGYDPTQWTPGRGQVLYSRDDGLSWQAVNPSDIRYVDPLLKTVTVRSNHLSLWTLAQQPGGLFGTSGGGQSAGGGGCLLSSGGQK